MGVISKTKTWVDEENVNYTDLNGNFDNVYNEVNGNLDNSNIKSSAAISTSKISGTAMNLSSDQSVSGVKTFNTRVVFNKATKPTLEDNGSGSSETFDLNEANVHLYELTSSSVTLSVSNASVGQVFIVRLLQDSSGNRGTTLNWWSGIKWAGGTEPTLTTTASKADSFGFLCTASGAYDGYIIGQNV